MCSVLFTHPGRTRTMVGSNGLSCVNVTSTLERASSAETSDLISTLIGEHAISTIALEYRPTESFSPDGSGPSRPNRVDAIPVPPAVKSSIRLEFFTPSCSEWLRIDSDVSIAWPLQESPWNTAQGTARDVLSDVTTRSRANKDEATKRVCSTWSCRRKTWPAMVGPRNIARNVRSLFIW